MDKLKFKVRFKEDAQVEEAPPAGQSGFVVRRIPKGTEMRVNAASLRFWQARGKVEIVEKPEGRREPEGRRPDDETEAGAMIEPGPVESVPARRISKAAIRRAVEACNAATGMDKLPELQFITSDDVAGLFPENFDQDSWDVILAAAEDLSTRGELSVNEGDLRSALEEVERVMLPPSLQRKHVA